MRRLIPMLSTAFAIALAAVLLLAPERAQAQLPGVNFQAVARDTSGTPLGNQSLDVIIEVIDSNLSTTVYSETWNDVVTNRFGLFNIQIGQGSTVDDFSAIDWSTGNKFLLVNIDGVDMGDPTQLLSVPYAYYAEEAGNAENIDSIQVKNDSLFVFTSNGLFSAALDSSAAVNQRIDTVFQIGNTVTIIEAGDTFDFALPDADSTNELIDSITVSAPYIRIWEQGSYDSLNILPLLFDNSPTNELIDSMSFDGTFVRVYEGGALADSIDLSSLNSIANDSLIGVAMNGDFLVITDGNGDQDSVNLSQFVLDGDLNDSLSTIRSELSDSTDLVQSQLADSITDVRNDLGSRIDSSSNAIQTHIATDNDTSATNEFQNLSTNGDTIFISDGNNIVFAGGSDDQTLSINAASDTISIEDGNDIDISDLATDAELATESDALNTRIDSSSTAIQNHVVADLDTDTTNELQNLSTNGDTIFISDGNNIVFAGGSDDQTLSINAANDTISIEDGNDIDISALTTDAELATESDALHTRIDSSSNAIQTHIATDNDTSASNELQNLSTNGDTIFISDGNNIVFAGGSDDQTLSINAASDTISIEDGNDIDISDLATDAELATESDALNTRIDSSSTAIQNHVVADLDTDTTNELQNLSTNGDTIFISDGNNIVFAGGSDDQTLSINAANDTISIEDGNDIDISALTTDAELATESDALNTRIDSSSTAIQNHVVADLDTDTTNELQDLSINGDTLFISGGDSVLLPAGSDDQTLSINTANDTISIEDGNDIDISALTTDAELATESDALNTRIDSSSTAIQNHVVADLDTDTTNELQDLSINGDTLFISGGDSVLLPAGSDDQTLSINTANDTISIEDGNDIDISALTTDAELATESDALNTRIDSSSTAIQNHVVADLDTDTTNELQDLSINGDTLFISGGDSVLLPAGSDDQTLSINTANDTISIEDGNDIDISALTTDAELATESDALNTRIDSSSTAIQNHVVADLDTDTTNELQDLSINGDTLFISGGDSVLLPAGSDDQTLSINTASDTISIEDGNDIDISALTTDAELASESNALNTRIDSSSTAIQAHVLADNDTSDTNEIQTLSLNTSTSVLSLSDGGGSQLVDTSNVNELQDLSLNGAGDSLLLSDGTGVSIASLNQADTLPIIQHDINNFAEVGDSKFEVVLDSNEAFEFRPTSIFSEKGHFLFTVPQNGASYNFGFGSENGANAYFGSGNVTGTDNIMLGASSGRSLTSGSGNIALGKFSLAQQKTGNHNIALGHEALSEDTAGTGNIALGYRSQKFSIGNVNNTSVGYRSLENISSGSANIALGTNAGVSLTSGTSNTYVGNQAGRGNPKGNFNIFLGNNAGWNAATNSNANDSLTGAIKIGNYAGGLDTNHFRLFIENDFSPNNFPLIYGEFDNNVLMINGSFQTYSGAGDTLIYPDDDGASGDVLTSDGDGNLTFQPIPSGSDDQTLSINTANDTISIEDGNDINISALTTDAELATESDALNTRIDSSSTAIQNHVIADLDTDTTNELQNLSTNGDTIFISDGNNIVFAGGSDDQTLSINTASDTISIEDGNDIDISALTTDAELATESDALNTRIDSSSTAIQNHIVDDNDTSATNEIQTLSLNTSTSVLSLSDGGGSQVVDTSNVNELQDLSVNGAGDSLLINGGTGVAINALQDTLPIIQSDQYNSVEVSTGQVAVEVDSAIYFRFEPGRLSFESFGHRIFIGDNAGNEAATQTGDIAIGGLALTSKTVTNLGDIAIGLEALENYNHTQGQNIAIGPHALTSYTTGGRSIVLGYHTYSQLVTGFDNIGLGFWSGASMTQGSNNVFIGSGAGRGITSGSQNVILGDWVPGSALSEQNGIIKIGYRAGTQDTNDNRLFIDNSATNAPLIWGDFASNTMQVNGTFRTAGTDTLTYPTADGAASGYVMATDGAGTLSLVDPSSLSSTDTLPIIRSSDSSTYVSTSVLDQVNIALDDTVFYRFRKNNLDFINSQSNVGIGENTFLALSSGFENTAVGENTMSSTTTGNRNQAMGVSALSNNTVGFGNTAIGYTAMSNSTSASRNVAIGEEAIRNSNGARNTALGYRALNTATSGDDNVAIGYGAGSSMTTGSGNILIGYNSGGGLASLSNKLYIDNTTTQSPLIWGDLSSTLANRVLQVNGTFRTRLDGNDTLTYPTSDGDSAYVMITDGAGNLSFVDAVTLVATDTMAIIADADRNTNINIDNANNIRFDFDGTERLVMDDNGGFDLSIDTNSTFSVTTRSQNAAGSHNKFEVARFIHQITDYTTGTGGYISLQGHDNNNGQPELARIAWSTIDGNENTGHLEFWTVSGGVAGQAMVIDSGQRVGIGTYTPSAPLHIEAGSPSNDFLTNGLLIHNTTAGANEHAYVTARTNNNAGRPIFSLDIDSKGGYAMAMNSTDTTLEFVSDPGGSGAPIMTMTPTDRVAIGGTAADSLLDVLGGARVQGLNINSNYSLPTNAPANGQIMQYNGTNVVWTNAAANDTVGIEHVLAKGSDANNDTIYNLGRLSIGTVDTTYPFNVKTNADNFAASVLNTTISAADKKGVFAQVQGSGAGDNFGLYGEASTSTSNNYGLYGIATGGFGTKIGVYGTTSGGGTNYAGYFDNGDVYINDNLGIGVSNPVRRLDVGGDLLVDSAFIDSLVIKGIAFPAPDTAVAGEVLTSNAAGQMVWSPTVGDDLGNHTATTDLDINGNDVVSSTTLLFKINGSNTFELQTGTNATRAYGQFRGITGNQSSPGFAFSSAPTTGLFLATTNTLGLTTGGSEAMRILSNGRIGIGTTAPSRLLDVAGRIKADSIQLVDGASNGYYLRSDAAGNAYWDTLSGPTTDTCPSGFVSVNGTFCIETTKRTGDDWFDAQDVCNGLDAKLPSWSEWYSGTQVSGVDYLSSQTWEWIDQASQNNASIVGGGAGTTTADKRKTVAADNPDSPTNTVNYRCVYYLKN